MKVQEAELSSKKHELEELKSLEHKLEKDQSEMSKKLDDLNNMLQSSQLQISQVKINEEKCKHTFTSDFILISLKTKSIN